MRREAKFSELFAISLSFNLKTSIIQTISTEIFILCWNVNENCDVDEKGKIGPVSHLGNYGTYLLSLVMLTTRVKKKSPLAGI